MKKIYLSALLLSCSTMVLAQRNTNLHSFNGTKGKANLAPSTVKPQSQTQVQTKVLNVLWTEDFSGGTGLTTSNGTWVAGGTNSAYWSIETVHPLSGNGWTSALNGDHLSWDSYNPNSNETAFATTPVDGEVVSPTISYTSTNSIGIQFTTEAMYCCNFNGAPFGVQVSTDDGATWSTTVPLNLMVDRNEPTEDLAHPLSISANLSSVVPAGSQTQFKLKFVWDGLLADANGQYNTHYFWMIDDLEVYEIPANDIAVTSTYWGTDGLNYYQIPSTQVAPIDFSATVDNIGAATQNNVTLNVDVDAGATFSGTSAAGVNIASGASDSLGLTTQWTPAAAVGTYNVTWDVSQDEVDDIPANNGIQGFTTSVTDYMYARDLDSPDGTQSNDGFGYEVGNLFDIWTDQVCKAVNVRLDATTEAGSTIYAKIYTIDPNTGDFVFEQQSDYYTITAQDISSGADLVLELLSPVNMTNATLTYLAVAATDGDGGATDDVVIEASGTSAEQTSFYFDATDATWYYTTATPMVRLNFDPTIGLEENENVLNVSLYPNPATDNVSIDYTLANASDVNVVLTDLAGKTISTVNTTANAGANTVSFDTNALTAGVYNVIISTENGNVTKKFVKK